MNFMCVCVIMPPQILWSTTMPPVQQATTMYAIKQNWNMVDKFFFPSALQVSEFVDSGFQTENKQAGYTF